MGAGEPLFDRLTAGGELPPRSVQRFATGMGLGCRRHVQEARNISRKLLRDRGMGRIPLTQVDNEFSDPEWPFTLVIEGDA